MSASRARAFAEDDIQAWVAVAYKLRTCRHFILRVEDSEEARQFLRALYKDRWLTSLDDSAPGNKRDDRSWQLNIGFTYDGLKALGLDEQLLQVFSERAVAFAEGAYRRAPQRLADTRGSAVSQWDESFLPASAHVLLTLHAESSDVLDRETNRLRPLGGGLTGWQSPCEGSHLANDGRGGFDAAKARRVHFGFVDGLSSVSIAGLPAGKTASGSNGIAAGEFVLGEPNLDGVNPWVLPTSPPQIRNFFRHGSFAVLRKLEQDEAVFRAFVGLAAERLRVDRDYVQAKMLGRWRDGRVISANDSGGAGKAPLPSDLDGFDFSLDPQGHGCPFGAHIRRMNPRGDPVVPSAKRPLIRRGTPYGPPFEVNPEASRGLLGLFFCASIENQFEHLVSQWADKNPMGTGILGAAKDPITGNHMTGAYLDIPMADGSSRALTGFAPFVRTRGTLYAFIPTLSALKSIAGLVPRERGRTTAPYTDDASAEFCPLCAPGQADAPAATERDAGLLSR